MKGIIFKKFLTMLEEQHGYKMVDEVINQSKVKNNGVYLSVGYYSHKELSALISTYALLSKKTVTNVMTEYGAYVFNFFAREYRKMIDGYENAFSFLSSVDNVIHIEVRKLYPDSELPEFITKKMDSSEIILVYKSSRKMAPFALGMMKQCLLHFNEKATIVTKALNEEQSSVEFTLKRQL